MDETDRLILNAIQKELPLASHPFQEIGRRLGLSEEEVITRLQRLKEEGIIRRIGAVIDPRSLGWVSTLCAARVPEAKIPEFVAVVNEFPGVTHNYERKAYYNIWFTLTAPSWEKVEETLKEISVKTGVDEVLHLPAREIFKVKVQFSL
ncbi:MAG: Lrp/AsnC family transcriptional regulator [Deltaproteobacteria bacterium]|nr:MAG: Lrp/AsnC family transcriptional regulator [Deltaproteobacteria bacterium]